MCRDARGVFVSEMIGLPSQEGAAEEQDMLALWVVQVAISVVAIRDFEWIRAVVAGG